MAAKTEQPAGQASSARLSQAQLSSVWLLSTSCSHPYAPGWKECPNCWWADVTARGRPVLAVLE